MSKVTMPEPVATVRRTPSAITYRHKSSLGLAIGTQNLITTDQAEAYAQARVNEALEEAAKECEQPSDGYVYTCADAGVASSALFRAAKAIRAMKKEQP